MIFLWEGLDEGKKNHLINWEVVCLPKWKGDDAEYKKLKEG